MITSVNRVLDGTLVLASATVDTPDGPFTGGACSLREDDALIRAGSEATERTRLLFEGPRRVVASEGAMAAGGSSAGSVDDANATEWLRCREVRSDRCVWLPADLVLLRWRGSRDLPIQQSSVGTAAHRDLARAVDNGARECVERYAVRRVWSGTTSLVDVTEQLRRAVPESLLQAIERHELRPHAWLITATLPVEVFVVMISSAQGRVTFGSSCAPSAAQGLRHALCEAVGVRAAFADAGRLKQSFAMSGDRVDEAVRTAGFQDAFLAFLRRLERPWRADDVRHEAPDVLAYLEQHHGVAPVIFDLGQRSGVHVVKVVVPSAEFFVPRGHRGYVLAPGYLE